MWYTYDNATISEKDPANQLAWLKEQLDEVEQKGEKVRNFVENFIYSTTNQVSKFQRSYSKY